MFIEPKLHDRFSEKQTGWIEIICGSMFSGKTEELIRRVNRATIAKQTVKILKPAIDKRYDEKDIISHNQNYVESIPIEKAEDILIYTENCQVVAIDEAQFFDNKLVEVCTELANHGFRVIVSGLDMNFEGKPFGVIPELMSVAEYVTKLHAICAKCGDVGNYSFRLVDQEEEVLLGEKNHYEARCRKCFNIGMEERKRKLEIMQKINE
ncbi:thymidine kinase [Rapidithrix thailandica]|uniref:Thymidine kinase n=1 Tax=Rapidithrix thailandica TaxID=413964 RepID=A0AAW9SBT0_9BACT